MSVYTGKLLWGKCGHGYVAKATLLGGIYVTYNSGAGWLLKYTEGVGQPSRLVSDCSYRTLKLAREAGEAHYTAQIVKVVP